MTLAAAAAAGPVCLGIDTVVLVDEVVLSCSLDPLSSLGGMASGVLFSGAIESFTCLICASRGMKNAFSHSS